MLWDRSLEIGVAAVDEQHRELFRRIDILLNPSNKNRFNEMMDFLGDYIVKHFADEQKIHSESSYPKAVMHKSYHDNYVRVFNQLKQKIAREGNTLTVNLEINKTVVGWLKNHILVHDREFSQYYNSRDKK